MTVKELIDKLSQYDESALVFCILEDPHNVRNFVSLNSISKAHNCKAVIIKVRQ